MECEVFVGNAACFCFLVSCSIFFSINHYIVLLYSNACTFSNFKSFHLKCCSDLKNLVNCYKYTEFQNGLIL